FSSSDLLKTLDSLQSNDCYTQLEVHVIDNSCDASESLLLQHLAQKKGFILHLAETNLGFGRACNQLYAATQSPYVFLINPDAYLLNGALDKLLAALEENNHLAASGPKIFWSAQQQFILPRSISFSPLSFFLNHYQNSFAKRILWFNSLLFRKKSIQHWQAQQPLQQQNLSGGSVLLRRSAVEKAGGLFDPDFFMYFEDSDLFKRLVEQGQQLVYIPDAQIVHQFSGCARDQQLEKNEFMAQSSEVFFNKYYAGNKLITWGKSSSAKPSQSLWQAEIIELGHLNSASEVFIQLPKTARYLVEWSPCNFFLPAAGLMLHGKTFQFPTDIWPILPSGHHYLRIAPVKDFWVKPKIWHWIIP
ncbi:MAG: glycosyltransferase family 2 protein, partial [Thiotrichaceae bacterium]|nr:glycosyltransferase family 2 protein [Thiotrichaceae bacterium]